MKKNILFLCTGNSCRSIMAEGLMRHYGADKFNVFSAGSNPIGKINQDALTTLEDKSIRVGGFYSKSWNEIDEHNIDIVITVCDNAAGESCPAFLGKSIKAHWGVCDPSEFEGSKEDRMREFKRICEIIEGRINNLLKLDIDDYSDSELQSKLQDIAKI